MSYQAFALFMSSDPGTRVGIRINDLNAFFQATSDTEILVYFTNPDNGDEELSRVPKNELELFEIQAVL